MISSASLRNVLVLAVCALAETALSAHGVSSKDARHLLSLDGPAIAQIEAQPLYATKLARARKQACRFVGR
jgi:hypothetical protein